MMIELNPENASLNWSERNQESCADKVRSQVALHDIALVKEFPTEVEKFVSFLGELGQVLENYEVGAGYGTPQGAYRFINRVRIDPRGKLLHNCAGALPPHSARSWAIQRPRFFAMLMVDPGCQLGPEGSNGETLLVRWQDALRILQQESQDFKQDLELLSRVALPFSANRVREMASHAPLIYGLPDRRHELDYGVRWKYDLREKVEALLPDAIRTAYLAAVQRLYDVLGDLRVQRQGQLQSGDLVVVDNNRVAHGRRTVRAQRLSDGGANTRELWSAAIL
jgi:hypothetical protein